jgi:hypothetical protein
MCAQGGVQNPERQAADVLKLSTEAFVALVLKVFMEIYRSWRWEHKRDLDWRALAILYCAIFKKDTLGANPANWEKADEKALKGVVDNLTQAEKNALKRVVDVLQGKGASRSPRATTGTAEGDGGCGTW